MPGPPKDNISHNAGVLLTKAQAKEVITRRTHLGPVIPHVAEEDAFRSWLSNMVRELDDLRGQVDKLKARVDLLQTSGVGTAVTV
jgi:hypothetical protein